MFRKSHRGRGLKLIVILLLLHGVVGIHAEIQTPPSPRQFCHLILFCVAEQQNPICACQHVRRYLNATWIFWAD